MKFVISSICLYFRYWFILDCFFLKKSCRSCDNCWSSCWRINGFDHIREFPISCNVSDFSLGQNLNSLCTVVCGYVDVSFISCDAYMTNLLIHLRNCIRFTEIIENCVAVMERRMVGGVKRKLLNTFGFWILLMGQRVLLQVFILFHYFFFNFFF